MAESTPRPDTPAPPSAVAKALRLLTLLAQAPEAVRLRDLAEQAGVAKSSAHRLLAELIDEGYVEPAGSGSYQPGTGLRVLAAAMEGHSGLGIAALLDDLADRVSHTVFLAATAGGAIRFTHKAQPALPYLIATEVGGQAPLTASAPGLAVLAHLPDEERAAAVAQAAGLDDLPAPDEAALAAARERGYAVEYGVLEPALCSIAAPVLDPHGYPVAAVVVTTLTYVVSRDELDALAPHVIDAAHEVGKRL